MHAKVTLALLWFAGKGDNLKLKILSHNFGNYRRILDVIKTKFLEASVKTDLRDGKTESNEKKNPI